MYKRAIGKKLNRKLNCKMYKVALFFKLDIKIYTDLYRFWRS